MLSIWNGRNASTNRSVIVTIFILYGVMSLYNILMMIFSSQNGRVEMLCYHLKNVSETCRTLDLDISWLLTIYLLNF